MKRLLARLWFRIRLWWAPPHFACDWGSEDKAVYVVGKWVGGKLYIVDSGDLLRDRVAADMAEKGGG